jgi:hypothetical protein
MRRWRRIVRQGSSRADAVDSVATEAGSGGVRRRLLTTVLGLLFVVSYLLFTVGLVVRKDLLDPEFYIRALADTDVYDRVYTEILADPEMQDRFREQLAINLDLVVEELYAQVVAAAALIVPPQTLQAATESVVRDVVTYVRGDSPRLEATMPNSHALDSDDLSRRMAGGFTAAISESLAEAPPPGEVVGAPMLPPLTNTWTTWRRAGFDQFRTACAQPPSPG